MKSFIEFKINESITHKRVIPRDFFNEGKLLTCMGFLQLKIHEHKLPENIDIKIEENGDVFDIIMNQEWYLLIVDNYPVTINGEEYLVGTSYNSKDRFPLKVVKDDTEIDIFNDTGDFSEAFIEAFS